VGVICTAAIAAGPSQATLLDHAGRRGREVVLNVAVEGDAAAARRRGDIAAHDAIISRRAAAMAEDVDVIVLGQASMAHLSDDLNKRLAVPVLTSPMLCIESLSAVFDEKHRESTG
jgi:Asp/Glu/hydantoin racemase